ncbi:MFS transporter [Allostreptomyces psammosilenae]|uniref:MFS family permease n=1 Tax=Allostreptomyces psammosilenae TaxID=1892865 RepID=A0A853A3W4_9ACTN|nr:MFS transporter [Allostreptomyces psammosilenae]NYI05178.1 MFS family permease [Allostreptomyces psammosilenae]
MTNRLPEPHDTPSPATDAEPPASATPAPAPATTPTTDALAPAVGRTRWGPIVVVALAMLMVTLETSLSAVTLPAIGQDLGVPVGATTWVLLAHSLPMAALSIPAGRWVDHADHRAVFLLAVTGVGLTSVLASVAPSFWLLLTARVLQGVTGALVVAVYMPIVAGSVRVEQRGRALGYVATIMPVGSMAGSSLGGLLADAAGWRPVFLIKLPVLLVVLWLGHRLLARGRAGLPAPDRSTLADALLLGGAVTTLLLALQRVPEGQAPLAGLLAVVAAGLAVWWARLGSSRPVIALVRRPAYALPLLSVLLMGSFVGLSLFLLPFFVAEVLDHGPATMGVAMMFFVGGLALGSPISGALADRLPARLMVAAGGAMSLGGMVSTLALGPGAGLADLSWRLALIGLGQAVCHVPTNTALLAAAPPDLIGTSGGVSATVRTVAFTVGPAVAALAYAVADGGAEGFRAGVVVLAVLQALGVLVGVAGAHPARTARAARPARTRGGVG